MVVKFVVSLGTRDMGFAAFAWRDDSRQQAGMELKR